MKARRKLVRLSKCGYYGGKFGVSDAAYKHAKENKPQWAQAVFLFTYSKKEGKL